MTIIRDLERLWKKYGTTGKIINYSSKPLWVIEADKETGKVIAHLLPPMNKSPPNVDADAFRLVDGKPVEGHSSWWKFYDYSTLEVFDNGNDLRVSVVRKTRVNDDYFGQGKIIYDRSEKWAIHRKAIYSHPSRSCDLQ